VYQPQREDRIIAIAAPGLVIGVTRRSPDVAACADEDGDGYGYGVESAAGTARGGSGRWWA
jgi:hypothetical protein